MERPRGQKDSRPEKATPLVDLVVPAGGAPVAGKMDGLRSLDLLYVFSRWLSLDHGHASELGSSVSEIVSKMLYFCLQVF